MRLSFSSGDHADHVFETGSVNLGAAAGNTIVLPRRDVAPWHARVSIDARGVVLEVLDKDAHTHVNARPVREKALLRQGDVLCLGKVVILLRPDSDASIVTVLPNPAAEPTPAQAPAQAQARIVLRGVAGSHTGKTTTLQRKLVIGRGSDCDLAIDEPSIARRHAVIEHAGAAIYLRELDGGGAQVNGVSVRNAVVHAGDQLTFDRNRYVIEAPGLPRRGETWSTSAQIAADAVGSADAAGETGEAGIVNRSIAWLILAACVIALGLGLLIHRGF